MTLDFTEKEFKEIQAESNQFHKTYIDLMGSYEEKLSKLDEQSVGLFYTFLTSVGVIAGFGFSALGNVVNRPLFFLGELMLLTLIVFGMSILFFYNKSKGNSYQEMGEKWHSLLSPRLSLYKEFLTLQITKKELFKRLNEDDKKVLNFSINSPKAFGLDKYFLGALIMLTLGALLLLSSFINFSSTEKTSKRHFYHQPSSYLQNSRYLYGSLER
ncbi:MAG: hypothetical protein ABI425_01805 [Patescibacteria group bacterium]